MNIFCIFFFFKKRFFGGLNLITQHQMAIDNQKKNKSDPKSTQSNEKKNIKKENKYIKK